MKNPTLRMAALASVLVFAVSGFALVGCDAQPASTDDSAMTVNVRVIGPDASGADSEYAAEDVAVAADDDAWTVSQKVFDDAELTYDAENSSYGVMLNSIDNPATGDSLAWDEGTGNYWQLFVDGTASEVGISEVELADGVSIVWYYSPFGAEVPTGSLPAVEVLAPAA